MVEEEYDDDDQDYEDDDEEEDEQLTPFATITLLEGNGRANMKLNFNRQVAGNDAKSTIGQAVRMLLITLNEMGASEEEIMSNLG